MADCKLYNAHEVAEIIAELFGDTYACNFNSIDEWLPFKCELLDARQYPVGVACWEQYLKHKPKCHEPKTNADRIRAMSDEELAEWMAECNAYGEHGEANQWLPWLQQPAEKVPDNA